VLVAVPVDIAWAPDGCTYVRAHYVVGVGPAFTLREALFRRHVNFAGRFRVSSSRGAWFESLWSAEMLDRLSGLPPGAALDANARRVALRLPGRGEEVRERGASFVTDVVTADVRQLHRLLWLPGSRLVDERRGPDGRIEAPPAVEVQEPGGVVRVTPVEYAMHLGLRLSAPSAIEGRMEFELMVDDTIVDTPFLTAEERRIAADLAGATVGIDGGEARILIEADADHARVARAVELVTAMATVLSERGPYR